jgi:hypothetical protein
LLEQTGIYVANVCDSQTVRPNSASVNKKTDALTAASGYDGIGAPLEKMRATL